MNHTQTMTVGSRTTVAGVAENKAILPEPVGTGVNGPTDSVRTHTVWRLVTPTVQEEVVQIVHQLETKRGRNLHGYKSP